MSSVWVLSMLRQGAKQETVGSEGTLNSLETGICISVLISVDNKLDV
jgi:hypothetical protein